MTPITLASYNIHKAIGLDRRRRPERIVEVLREVGADVVALQEADRRFGSRASAIPFHMLADHGDYHAVPFDVRAGSMGWHGNTLLVRDGVTVLRHAEPRPTVMMGDLNDWSAAAGGLRDFAHDHHFAATGPSFHARRPVARLDRIMLSRDIAVEATGVHQSPTARTASDHLPVWARVRVG